MKTSNKILLGIITIIGLSMLSILVFAKSSLINYTDNQVNGNGNIIVKTHNIGEIALFQSKHNYEVIVKKGAPLLTIETDENIHEFLNPHVTEKNNPEDNKSKKGLRIGKHDNVNIKPSQGIKMQLTVPTLEEVNLSGFSTIIFEDTLESKNFKARVTGSSNLYLKINTEDLDIDTKGHSYASVLGVAGNTDINASGSSEIELDSVSAQNIFIKESGHSSVKIKGQSQNLNADLGGSANLNADDLTAEQVAIKASGHAKAKVVANQILQVNGSGSADIIYSGNPQITKKLSGHASLTDQNRRD